MPAVRLEEIIATLSKLTRRSPEAKRLTEGPGCTCESCVQAWSRQQSPNKAVKREPRRHLRIGLY